MKPSEMFVRYVRAEMAAHKQPHFASALDAELVKQFPGWDEHELNMLHFMFRDTGEYLDFACNEAGLRMLREVWPETKATD